MVTYEKPVVEARYSSGTQEKGTSILKAATKQRSEDRILVCVSDIDL
jgi:hypothetical protein